MKNSNEKKLRKYKKYFINFTSKHHLKLKITKILTFIIIFVLFFDKAVILFLTYLYSIYIIAKQKEHYTNNDALVATTFDSPNNNTALLSKVFKHPELNLKSYTNIKIDPAKVLFEDNKFLPECCFYNSEYSSSKGCPCITGDQQSYLNTRGINKSYLSFIQADDDYKNVFFSPTLAFKGAVKPFNRNDEKFITDYEALTSEKKTEFNSLINNY
jgi:hypothetical protein